MLEAEGHRLELKIGAPITDGGRQHGFLQHLMFDAGERRVTALVSAVQGTPDPAIVPLPHVATASKEGIRLKSADDTTAWASSTTLAEFTRLAMYRQLHARTGVEVTQTKQTLLSGDNQDVYCSDGWAGELRWMVLDRQGRTNEFVVRRSAHRWLPIRRRDVIVPGDWIEHIDARGIHLRAELRALDSLPEYRSDEQITAEAERAVRSAPDLKALRGGAVKVKVDCGKVDLAGHVGTKWEKIRAEQVVRAMRGVREVHNRLVDDGELMARVADALARDDRTQHETILVAVRHGFVTLSGCVKDATIRYAAEENAAGLATVRAVINHIWAPGVSVDRSDQHTFQPLRGQEVFSTDMLLGHVAQVIINPRNRRVTAIVVDGQFPDPQHWQRRRFLDDMLLQERRVVIPLDVVKEMSEVAVWLGVTAVEAARYSDFRPPEYLAPHEGWVPPFPYDPQDVLVERSSGLAARPKTRKSDNLQEPGMRGLSCSRGLGQSDEGLLERQRVA